ncbi:1-phosphatidylinositol 4,5-bisphosphate phosphodiesterase classes I and II [Neocloeon triangulifer]|uniref:1-phosphatidylinositol 4,5-bisphosphate phosphodiesterase classes I and II n=1 Tax=Neocloeon triangulifer TaxID=2078957 RepID=UPI00286F3CDF|nr:1-phosphatidylinositol 4,5-bisphosphate phosphodiesterase classes I and II [Neocloeon triangulifer]
MAAAVPRAGARPLEVPRALQEGDKFVRWDEDSGVGCPVTLRVDPNGFYLYWTDQNNEVDMIDLVTVRDTRNGKNAKIPKDPKLRQVVCMGSQEPLEDKTLTVCYGSDFVNPNFVNFCCSNKETAEMWANEVVRLAYNLVQLNGPTSMFLLKAHTKLTLMADKAGKILVKNILKTFAQNKEDRKRVEKALEASGLLSGKNDIVSVSKFQYEDFFTLYKNLTQRTELEPIFDSLCCGSKRKLMTAEQFVEFLNKSQRDPRLNEILYPYANVERAKDLINQHEPNKSNAQRGVLSQDGFLRYLLSEDNPIVSSAKAYQLDDMDHPLPHYFINSSHNTYLTGHQLTGKSSVEIYRQCLLAGCRCVELDFWNGRTEEPVIVHGYTFVPEISAKEVIEAIAETAFKTSDYPVILSFENHCNTRQQAKIAQYCREFFGDMLLELPLDSFKLEPGSALPPPAALRRKIIIKNKKKHHKKGHAAPSGLAAAAVASALPVTQHGNGEVPSLLKDNSRDSREDEDPNDDEDESSSEEEEEVEKSANKVPDEKSTRETEAGEELSALVNYVQPVHFTSFENAEKKKRSYEMSSFDEKQATTLLKERPIEFVNYNKYQLSRVYPAGTRFDSSNFMPQVFWNAGCQLVALNYQNLDLAMQLNLGIFEYNQRCGYLLKPEYMRRRDRRFDPFAESTVDGIIAGTVSVQVISGQFLTEKRVGTYIEVDMFGLPADTVRKRFKTKIVAANGINPCYDEEPFVFKKVVLPELATIRLAAYEESGRIIGHRVIPVLGLCPGYRQVGLRNEFGQPLGLSSVFVHVVVKDYVPDGLSDFAEALANPIKYQSELEKRAQQLSVLTDDLEDIQEVLDETASKESMPTKARRSQLHSTTSSELPSIGAAGTGTLPRASVQINQTEPNQVEEAESVESLSEGSPAAKGSPGPAIHPISASAIAEISAETFEQLLENKVVKEKKLELEKKLESLRKKQEKEKARFGGHKTAPEVDKSKGKFYMSHKLVKRLSSKNIEVEEPTETDPESRAKNLAREHLALEKDLQEKYNEAVFSTLEKVMKTSQAAQLKLLASLVERETAEVMKKLESVRRDEVKALAKIHKDKDELVRIKREVASSIVEKGVSERVRLKEAYRKRQEDLERQHAEVRARLEEERLKSKTALAREYDGRLALISEEGGSGT